MSETDTAYAFARIDSLEKQLSRRDKELAVACEDRDLFSARLDDAQSKLRAFEEAMEREKKPEWSESLKDLAHQLEHNSDALTRHNAARELRYMADSFTLKANFVPAELRIKELEADCAVMRELLGKAIDTFGHAHWDSTMHHGTGCGYCIAQREVRAAYAKLPPTPRRDK